MQELLYRFDHYGDLLYLEPQVYSGECRHLGLYAPEQTHHAVVMIDHLPDSSEFYFSTIFSYFAEENPFAEWTLSEARKNMSSYWLDHGKMLRGQLSTRVEIPYEEGGLAYIYWFRQDALTGDLYYITYMGNLQKAFCELKKHNK